MLLGNLRKMFCSVNAAARIVIKPQGSQKNEAGKKSPSESGQIAVILIFIVAVGIMFYMLAANFGKLGQGKVATMKGAATGAASLVSLMASYGEKLMQEQLGGERKVCESTDILTLIITLVVLIIIMVITVGVGGAAALGATISTAGMLFIAAAVAAVFTVVSLAIQYTVIQPGITSMWNKLMQGLKPVDNFMETGIQAALQATVVDPVQIPDFYDFDNDRIYGGLTSSLDKDSAPDYISRFAFYNTLRLQGIKVYTHDTSAVQDFMDALREFVYDNGDNQGLWDPIDCTVIGTGNHPCCPADINNDASFPAICDRCCVPQTLVTASGTTQIRPSCCDLAVGNPFKCGNPLTCDQRTFIAGYPWVYDPFYENSTNAFRSFRELIGKDDEHRDFIVNSASPNWDWLIPGGAQLAAVGTGFIYRDTTGLYKNPEYVPSDTKTGIFPLLYEDSVYGLQLTSLTYADPQCHWCEAAAMGCPNLLPWFPQLAPLDNLGVYNGSPDCVDNANRVGWVAGEPPQLADAVPSLNIRAPDNQCASGPTGVNGWKPGGDRYCSNVYPYGAHCAKNNVGTCFFDGTVPVDCECADVGVNPTLWPDDHLDEFVYGLQDFFAVARSLLSGDPDQLYLTLTEWYDAVLADWIEPPCPTPPCNGSVSQETRAGAFWVWRDELQWFVGQLNVWLSSGFASDSVWCVPTANSACMPAAEIATFDSNANGIRGDINDIMACLDWNANDPWILADGTTITGNAAKFLACADPATCTANEALCAQLPRSLIPNYCATWKPFQTGFPADQTAFLQCLNGSLYNTCEVVPDCVNNCGALPATYTTSDGTVHPYPSVPFTPPTTQSVTVTGSGCGVCPLDWTTLDTADTCSPILASSLGACCLSHQECDTATPPNCVDVCDAWTVDCSITYTEVTDYGSCTDPTFFADINSSGYAVSLGSCGDADVFSGFQAATLQSGIEAGNQVLKFRKRLSFLQRIVPDVVNMRDTLTNVVAFITAFIDGGTDYDTDSTDSPSELLITARKNVMDTAGNVTEAGLPSVAVYVWQDPLLDEVRSDGSYRGYWHAVKVEARLPRRCNNACGVGGTADPEWPKVKTYTKNWGMTRCYEMDNTEGMVKVRAIRWDEDRDPVGLFFPNGVPIWGSLRLSHPTTGPGDPGNIALTCHNYIAPELLGQIWWGDAFMLNKSPAEGDADYTNCWQNVHTRMLEHGVVTDACAKYFIGDGTMGGVSANAFRMKFVPCDGDFDAGVN